MASLKSYCPFLISWKNVKKWPVRQNNSGALSKRPRWPHWVFIRAKIYLKKIKTAMSDLGRKIFSPKFFCRVGYFFQNFLYNFHFQYLNFFVNFFTLFKSIEIFVIHDYFTIRFQICIFNFFCKFFTPSFWKCQIWHFWRNIMIWK